ncbi:MBL fold metallo-hydrolase [Nocardioides dongxiaopingii]|uniref:MBL fold metallo-hydrolase n=1 Tax=Nocardioides sp. S-1144 TaxID=2582905 RepID=UPI00110DF474|nr:MBL fold metallo-hydrolase [Nocardioides sp. S-1144]QCW50669.1 MBL fold metallo-hydrolase [Nocardioides sp. S-1144]
MTREPRAGGIAGVTWWGHSSMTIDLPTASVATDPLMTRRLYHLRRAVPEPPEAASRADVVLVSHLHHDHLHLPSLARFAPEVPLVVPRGAPAAVKGLHSRELVEVAPGDSVVVAGVSIDVLPATHDGRRDNLPRRAQAVPALGFRFTDQTTSVWYPGDTGVRADFADVAPVDLAAVPIGGWGPTLGEEHLDPEEAVAAVAAVGARWALAVHYGTYWPLALRRLHPRNHDRLFVTPPQRFHRAAQDTGLAAVTLTPGFGERVELG